MTISVHLQKFPKLTSIDVDREIVEKMDKVREICNCVLSLRKDANIRVRMPLKKIVICGNSNLNDEYLNLIKQEVNTKEIEIFDGNIDKIASKEVVLDMKECGKVFGSQLKDILIAQKKGDWKIVNDKLSIAGLEIDKNLFSIKYSSKDGKKVMQCKSFNLLVMIDTGQTEELIIEGLARDIVRIIQQTRKDNNFEISDRIDAIINTKDKIFDTVLKTWKAYIREQTLADNININNNEASGKNIFNIEKYTFSIDIKRKK